MAIIKHLFVHPTNIKGPDHLQKNLFKKITNLMQCPKKSKTSFGRFLLRLKILQVPSKAEMRSCFFRPVFQKKSSLYNVYINDDTKWHHI